MCYTKNLFILNNNGFIPTGIIIDTFGSLKEVAQEKEEILEQNCFICNIEREKLDKAYPELVNGFL